MSDNVRRDNRRALPKYLLTILLFGLLGGVLGFFTGVAGAAGVAETVRQALDRVLAVCAPWGIVGSAVVLLGAGWPHSAPISIPDIQALPSRRRPPRRRAPPSVPRSGPPAPAP